MAGRYPPALCWTLVDALSSACPRSGRRSLESEPQVQRFWQQQLGGRKSEPAAKFDTPTCPAVGAANEWQNAIAYAMEGPFSSVARSGNTQTTVCRWRPPPSESPAAKPRDDPQRRALAKAFASNGRCRNVTHSLPDNGGRAPPRRVAKHGKDLVLRGALGASPLECPAPPAYASMRGHSHKQRSRLEEPETLGSVLLSCLALLEDMKEDITTSERRLVAIPMLLGFEPYAPSGDLMLPHASELRPPLQIAGKPLQSSSLTPLPSTADAASTTGGKNDAKTVLFLMTQRRYLQISHRYQRLAKVPQPHPLRLRRGVAPADALFNC